MENFNIEGRYLKLYYEFRDCFTCTKVAFWTRLSKILNVSVNQKTRSNICFKTCSRAFETISRAFETLGRDIETLSRVLEGLREK